MATANVTPAPEGVIRMTKKYRFFDIDKMDFAVVEKTIDFKPATELSEAIERLGSNDKLLGAVNQALRDQALSEARKEATAKGASKSAVLNFARSFRFLPKYAAILVTGPDGKATKESKYAQTQAILKFIGSQPALLEAVKALDAEMDGEESEDDGDDE